MVRVISGELSPIIAGQVYCTAIEGCQEISDFARVDEWTAAMARWCEAQPGLLAFTGQCAVHRGQLLRLHGDWTGALTEFDHAFRLRGDYVAADAAYQEAADRGCDPQPGLALLWLAQGRTDAAASAIACRLAEPGGPVQRCQILPAAVEVRLATDDVAGADAAAAELSALAAQFGSLPLAARAAQAAGGVGLSKGDPAGALPYLRRAHQAWMQADAPFDAAVVRVLIGRALTDLGDGASGRRELEAAGEVLRRVGAAPAAAEVGRLLAPKALPAGLTAREAEVLRLVATGRSNPQIAADLVLSEKTVARHLSNIFAKIGVGSRTAAAGYAYTHDLA